MKVLIDIAKWVVILFGIFIVGKEYLLILKPDKAA